MVDDIISTAGTVCSGAALVKKKGAKRILVGATHGVLAGKAIERIKKAPFDEVVITDTIPSNDAVRSLSIIKILTVAELLGEAIRRTHKNESISSMFNQD